MNREVPDPRGSTTWHTAGGNNSRCGLSGLERRIRGSAARRLPVTGIVHASAVFDDSGATFVADRSGAVQAFSPGGTLRWSTKLTGGISATPVSGRGKPQLFVGSHDGAVCALDADTGEVQWRTNIRSRTDPRILSDLLWLEDPEVVILSSWGGRFIALETTTGEEKFGWDAGLHARSAAAADNQGNIYSLRAVRQKGVEFVLVTKEGREHVLLTEPEDERGANRVLAAAGPVLDESRDVAYLVLNHKTGANLVAWSTATAKEAWRRTLTAQVEATPAVLQNGAVVVADLSGAVRSFTPEGEPGFVYKTGSEYLLAGGVATNVGDFFLGDPLGNVHHVDANGAGRIICELPRSIEARPSFSPGGELYVPASDKFVHVFEPET